MPWKLRPSCASLSTIQIAGSLNLRVIVTLFDFYESFPDSGSGTEAKNLDYLRALLPSFAGDDRILAWDLHNEPDNYSLWKAGDPQKVLRLVQSSRIYRLPGPDRVRIEVAHEDLKIRALEVRQFLKKLA